MKKDILEIINPVIHTLRDVELPDSSAVIILAKNKKSNSGHIVGSFSDITDLLLEITFRDKNFGMAMRAAIEFLDQQDDADNDLESK